jgi:hypothetical protein
VNKAELEYHNKVREIGCIVCKIFLQVFSHCDVHHLVSGSRRKGHMEAIGLCPTHHRSGLNNVHVVSRHPWKREFESRYGTEEGLLIITRGLIAKSN